MRLRRIVLLQALGLFLLWPAAGFLAAAPVADDPELLVTLALKTAKIPAAERLKVMYLQPGADGWSTADEAGPLTAVIRAAGGLAPAAGSRGPVLDLWRDFQPDAALVRSSDRAAAEALLQQPGWREAPAARNRLVLSFPDALVDRAADFPGYFAAWLAGSLYAKQFARADQLVHPQEVISERPLELNLPYVARARIVDSRILDFVHRTLLIDFKKPQNIISTGDGALTGALVIGNSFSPTPTWAIYHNLGYAGAQKPLYEILKVDPSQASILGTGADLNNLAVVSRTEKDLTVTALVTAGVEGNALRAAKDAGSYFEPGTINIIVLTNRRLAPAALARSLITITEAKTAALWDMDIRSVQSPLLNPATGTGTDDIIVVEGEGPILRYAGGHSKLGQLLGEAVYAGVREALFKQNGKMPRRPVSERLAERGLFFPQWAELLQNPRYQGFLELALSLSDAQIMGQAVDLSAFESLSLSLAGEIAGRRVDGLEKIGLPEDLPPVLATAAGALAAGLKQRGK